MSEHPWHAQAMQHLEAENREVSGDKLLHLLLDIEGVDQGQTVSADRSELDRLSLKHFRSILEKNDPRWRLVYQMDRLTKEGVLIKKELAHAIKADYLSDHPSIRRGWSRYTDHVTIAQLSRALANVEIGHQLEPQLQNLLPLSKMYDCQYVAGDVLENERGVTGCQEALWQLQLFEDFMPDKDYLGRIGFNFHIENNQRVVSITNIQGASNSQEGQELFVELAGHGFADFLVNILQRRLGNEFIYRGVGNRPDNKVLYKSTFRHAKIPTYNLKRFTGEKHFPSFETT